MTKQHLHVLCIYNPTAGGRRRRRLFRVIRALRRRGCRVALRSTRARGDAETFARQALQNREFGGGPDVVVAAGGDGTINEVVNGMIGSAMPLAILPLGTANVLAAEIGTPRSADAIADAIVAGRTRSVHIGTANNRAFLQMAGIGMDAHVVERVSSPLKHLMGKAAYGLAILRWLMAPPLTRYEVHVGNLRFSAASVIVANGRYYGGTFVCAPAASLDSPTFEVCIFEKGGRFAGLVYLARLGLGLLGTAQGYRILTTPEATVFVAGGGPGGEPVQADGDIVTRLPVRLEVTKSSLSLIVSG